MSEIEYIVHEQPVRRAAANYVAMADLNSFGFPGQREQLWLERNADLTYTLCCLPFRTYGLALDDEVALSCSGDTVSSVIRKSGRRVLRIFLAKTLSESTFMELRTDLMCVLDEAVADSEWSGDRHVAVDVPVGSSVKYIENVIRPYLATGHVYWEWADALEFRV